MGLDSFGKRLTEVRKSKKISQDELGKTLSVVGAVIGRYERGEVKPSIDTAAAIAEALEVSLDYLVGNTDLLLDKAIVKRIGDIQRLDKEEREHVNALLDAFLRDSKAKKAYAK
jgi:transcriptional regulator with XRE-family HTH domain